MKRCKAFMLAVLLAVSALVPSMAYGGEHIELLTLDDRLDAMMPALDSIARAMGVDGEAGYAPRNAQFFWTVMYLMGQNWGHTHPDGAEADWDGETVVSLQESTLIDMAEAAFFDFNALPELVDTTAICYDADNAAYLFAPSDMGTTFTRIESYSEQENGNVSLVLGFYVDGGVRCGGFEFTLTPAENADDSPYAYRIMSASTQVQQQ